MLTSNYVNLCLKEINVHIYEEGKKIHEHLKRKKTKWTTTTVNFKVIFYVLGQDEEKINLN